MRKVIMTGATGFIGSWLLEELVSHDVQITALVCDDAARIPLKSNAVQIVQYNPNDIFAVKDICQTQYDAFFNLGWAGVSPEQKNNTVLQINNIRCSLDALSFAYTIGCGKFIGIGTVAEYVFCDGLISTKQPPSPSDAYGAAKVSAHVMSEALARQLNQPFHWVIVPSTFGERRTDNNIISYTIQALLKKEKPTFTPLEQMWDFLYITDVVAALYLIAEKGISGKSYGIGSGIYKPLKNYIIEIRDLIDPSLPLGIGERPYADQIISSSCVDNSILVADTGFNPKTSFTEGALNTIQYFKERTG